eukprot:5742512-Prymnesium_polylepis.1
MWSPPHPRSVDLLANSLLAASQLPSPCALLVSIEPPHKQVTRASMRHIARGMALRDDMFEFLFRRRLLTVPGLIECDAIEGFVTTLVSHLKPAVFMMGEVRSKEAFYAVLIPGKVRPTDLFLVLHGRVAANDGSDNLAK